jgi:hypothetical protein
MVLLKALDYMTNMIQTLGDETGNHNVMIDFLWDGEI